MTIRTNQMHKILSTSQPSGLLFYHYYILMHHSIYSKRERGMMCYHDNFRFANEVMDIGTSLFNIPPIHANLCYLTILEECIRVKKENICLSWQ